MAAQLRAKPGADAVPVADRRHDDTHGAVAGSFTLVYLVADTIMNVTTQDEQLAVFANAAAHLEPGGCFVIELIVPQLRRVPPTERGRVFTLEPDHVGIETFDDVADQIVLVASLDHRRRTVRAPRRALPIRLARRARPDGQARGLQGARSVGRLGLARPSPRRARSKWSCSRRVDE